MGLLPGAPGESIGSAYPPFPIGAIVRLIEWLRGKRRKMEATGEGFGYIIRVQGSADSGASGRWVIYETYDEEGHMIAPGRKIGAEDGYATDHEAIEALGAIVKAINAR